LFLLLFCFCEYTKIIIIIIIIIGNNENKRQTAVRNKRQGKASKLSDRLRVQIDKLGVAKSKF